MTEFPRPLSPQELARLQSGDIIITVYPKLGRRVKGGSYAAQILTVEQDRRWGCGHLKEIHVRWNYGLKIKQPTYGSLRVLPNKIECGRFGCEVVVRLPNDTERRNHLERIRRDQEES